MKITTNQLRRIIKEEVEQEKLRRTIRKSVRQELICEGFFDKIKSAFGGGGMMKDFSKLLSGIRTLTGTSRYGANLENPKYANDFLGKEIHDSKDGSVSVPGKKQKGFYLLKMFNWEDGSLVDNDLVKKLVDLQKQYQNKKLKDEQFQKKVHDLTGVIATRWSEFEGFAKDLMAACKAKEDAAKKASDDAYEQGQRERSARAEEDRELRMKVARKLRLDMDDPRVDAEMDRVRGRDDRLSF